MPNHYVGDLLHTIAISGLSRVRTELLQKLRVRSQTPECPAAAEITRSSKQNRGEASAQIVCCRQHRHPPSPKREDGAPTFSSGDETESGWGTCDLAIYL